MIQHQQFELDSLEIEPATKEEIKAFFVKYWGEFGREEEL